MQKRRELKLKIILQNKQTKEHIKFEREKTFNDLKSGHYRFDFYIEDLFGRRAIIELNGI